jgi:hypothetical protein
MLFVFLGALATFTAFTTLTPPSSPLPPTLAA